VGHSEKIFIQIEQNEKNLHIACGVVQGIPKKNSKMAIRKNEITSTMRKNEITSTIRKNEISFFLIVEVPISKHPTVNFFFFNFRDVWLTLPHTGVLATGSNFSYCEKSKKNPKNPKNVFLFSKMCGRVLAS
jgi:hypothetical protein